MGVICNHLIFNDILILALEIVLSLLQYIVHNGIINLYLTLIGM